MYCSCNVLSLICTCPHSQSLETPVEYQIKQKKLQKKTISNGNRTDWSQVQSVIIRVIRTLSSDDEHVNLN